MRDHAATVARLRRVVMLAELPADESATREPRAAA